MDDADVEVLDEDEYAGAGVGSADAHVVESAGVAQGEFTELVDAVGADSVVGVETLPGDCALSRPYPELPVSTWPPNSPRRALCIELVFG
ncbi:hypothetical protein BST12_23765 [Mycobacterium angelicum]|uniref:Uncharacterized protein n=1 Tax=Mycobacterium angelicum TaxID=470074 RepID=A0A1W9ZES9_MYCAN|nr:hypothetical protein BST12_23765 [Mycobacterium angelicum]